MIKITQEENSKIDYEIEAKRKARNKEITEWNIAIVVAAVFFIIVFAHLMAGA